jgi:hypothetical protein
MLISLIRLRLRCTHDDAGTPFSNRIGDFPLHLGQICLDAIILKELLLKPPV